MPNLGDAAYYRPNRSYYTELMVRSGARVLTIQMSVPTGRTPHSILPNAVGLAKALLAKLQQAVTGDACRLAAAPGHSA